MTACPESGPSAGMRLTIGPTPDDEADSCPPVVSLSPSSIARGVSGVSHQRMFLSPRVIDQAAFDDLSTQLRTLIDRAAAVADTLNETMSRAETLEASSTRATGQLQERLRLGARMIKALQTQLDRVSRETKSDDATQQDGKVEGAVDAQREAAHRIESRVQSVESSLTDATDQALRRFEQVERGIAERERTLHELDDRIARLESRLDTVGQAAIEDFDRRVGARQREVDDLAGRVDELSARVSAMSESISAVTAHEAESAAVDVRQSLTDLTNRGAVASRRLESMIEQADEARRLLEGDLLAAADQIDELGEQAGGVQQRLADHVGAAAERQAQLQRVLEQSGRAGPSDSDRDHREPEIVVRRERAE